MRHILSAESFSTQFLEELFERADYFKREIKNTNNRHSLKRFDHSLMFSLFYEPSTRTRMSFETAAAYFGMAVVGTENAREFSSAVKGETLEDTIRVLCQYHPDVIVLRHPETGAAKRAAGVSSVPIINAGDGKGEHPTQALLDLYTIKRYQEKLDGLTVLLGGDLAHGRTARSLVTLLSKFCDVKFIFISPPQLRIGQDIRDLLSNKGLEFSESENLEKFLELADVVYWTRIQKERLGQNISYKDIVGRYVIGQKELGLMKKAAILMHPLPRVNEIKEEADSDPRAVYFQQAGNGLYIRIALLEWIFEE